MKNFFRGFLCAVFVVLALASCSGGADGTGTDNSIIPIPVVKKISIIYDSNGGECYDEESQSWIKDGCYTTYEYTSVGYRGGGNTQKFKVGHGFWIGNFRFPKKSFMGWSTTPSATKVEYCNGDYCLLTSDVVRLYAVWSDAQLLLSSSSNDLYIGDTLNVSIEANNLDTEIYNYALEMRIVKNDTGRAVNYLDDPFLDYASDIYRWFESDLNSKVEQQIKIPYHCPEGEDYIICARLHWSDNSNDCFSIMAFENITIRTKPTLRLSLENNTLSTYKYNQSLIKYTVANSGNSDDTDKLIWGGYFCAQKGDVVKKIAITRNSNASFSSFYRDTNTSSWPIGTYDSIAIDNAWEVGTWTGWVELQNPTGVYFRKSDAVIFTVGYNVSIPEVNKEFYVIENKFKIPSMQNLGIDTSNRDWLYWNCGYGDNAPKANDGDEIALCGHTVLRSYFKYHNPPKIKNVEFVKDYVRNNLHWANFAKIYLDPNDISDASYILFKFGLTSDVSQAFVMDPSQGFWFGMDEGTIQGDNPYVVHKLPCPRSPCEQTVYVFAKKVMSDGSSDFSSQSIECDVENLSNPKDFEIILHNVTHIAADAYTTIKFSKDPRTQQVRFYYSESINSEKKLFFDSQCYHDDCPEITLSGLLRALSLVENKDYNYYFPTDLTYWIEGVDCIEELLEAQKEFYGTTSEVVEIPELKGASTKWKQ